MTQVKNQDPGLRRCLEESDDTANDTIFDNRRRSGESYIAGGAALNELLGAARLSDDLDIYHDTAEAGAWCFSEDFVLIISR